jgi:ABC-type enterochelin transport system permease subunit
MKLVFEIIVILIVVVGACSLFINIIDRVIKFLQYSYIKESISWKLYRIMLFFLSVRFALLLLLGLITIIMVINIDNREKVFQSKQNFSKFQSKYDSNIKSLDTKLRRIENELGANNSLER